MNDFIRSSEAASGFFWTVAFGCCASILQGQIWPQLAAWIGDERVAFSLSWLLATLPLSLLMPRPKGVRALAGLGLAASPRHHRYLAAGLGTGALLSGGIVAIQSLGGWIAFDRTAESVSWAQPSAAATLLLTLVLSLAVFSIAVAGEELLLRGYGFQQLGRALSPMGAACASGLMFGLMHYRNPNISVLGILNTTVFGIAFGLAMVRHRSLWLPFGLHLGWNLTLGALGVRISGLTISVFGFTGAAQGSTLWSGGRYGPEASLLTTAGVALLLWIIWRLPVLADHDRLIWDGPETVVENQCDPSPTLVHSPSPPASPLTQASTTPDAKNSSAT